VPLSEVFHGRATANGDDGIELARDPQPRQRGIGHQRQALAGEVVADREDPKAPAVAQRVRREVQAPTLIGSLRERDRRPGAGRALAAKAPADLQPFLPIEAAKLPVVHDQLNSSSPYRFDRGRALASRIHVSRTFFATF